MKHYQWKQLKWADEVFELSHWFIYPNANSVCEHLFVFVEETFLFRNISSYLRPVPRFRAAARSPAVTARLCYADNQRHLPVQSKDCSELFQYWVQANFLSIWSSRPLLSVLCPPFSSIFWFGHSRAVWLTLIGTNLPPSWDLLHRTRSKNLHIASFLIFTCKNCSKTDMR